MRQSSGMCSWFKFSAICLYSVIKSAPVADFKKMNKMTNLFYVILTCIQLPPFTTLVNPFFKNGFAALLRRRFGKTPRLFFIFASRLRGNYIKRNIYRSFTWPMEIRLMCARPPGMRHHWSPCCRSTVVPPPKFLKNVHCLYFLLWMVTQNCETGGFKWIA